MKRTLFVMVMLIAAASIVTASGSDEQSSAGLTNINPPGVFPIAKEQMVLKAYMGVADFVIDIHTNEAILWIEEYTNIDLEIDAGPQNSQEKVSLMLAAQQDLPDFFLTYGAISPEQLALYGEQGVFASMNPYLEDGWLPEYEAAMEYQPLIRPQMTMPDGNIYSFVWYNECYHCMYSQKLFMNMKWLENLGLDTPTTPDEFYDVLKAFRDNDANGNGNVNDEIPLLGMTTNWRTDITGFLMQPFAPASDRGALYLYNDNGTIKSGMHHPGWPEGIAYLAKLYREKLLDEEIFVMDRPMARALTGATPNRVGAIQAGWWGGFLNLGVPGAREEMVPIEPLKAADGSQRTPYFAPNASPRWVVTENASDAKELAAMRLGDFHMQNPFTGDPKDLEIGLNRQYGPNGWIVPEGKLSQTGEPAWFEWTFEWAQPTNKHFANLNTLFNPKENKSTMAVLGGDRFDAEQIGFEVTRDLYEKHGVNMVVPPVIFPSDMASELGEIKQILSDAMEEGIASFIIGDRDAATEWGDFLNELVSLGFNTYLKAVQDAYDAMYK